MRRPENALLFSFLEQPCPPSRKSPGFATASTCAKSWRSSTSPRRTACSQSRGASIRSSIIPGGFGTRVEINNARLHAFIRELPEKTLLVSVCTGSWIYGRMGLLDGLAATNRKEPDRLEQSAMGKVPIDRLAEIAPKCRISRARVVDAGRVVPGGGITSGMEVGFHLLRRAGYDEGFISEVARVMEYSKAYDLYKGDLEYAGGG